MTGDKPLEFWLNSCLKAYSQLPVLAVDQLAAPASQAFVERCFLFVECLVIGEETEWRNL